jgi:hypothetical protein
MNDIYELKAKLLPETEADGVVNPLFEKLIERLDAEQLDKEIEKSEHRCELTREMSIGYDHNTIIEFMRAVPEFDIMNGTVNIDSENPLAKVSKALARFKNTNQFSLNLSTELVSYDDEQGRFDTLRRCKALFDRFFDTYTCVYDTADVRRKAEEDNNYIGGETQTALKGMIRNITFALYGENIPTINYKDLFFIIVCFINLTYANHETFRRYVLRILVVGLLDHNVENIHKYICKPHEFLALKEEEELYYGETEEVANLKMVTRKTFVNKEIDLALSNGAHNGLLLAELVDHELIKQGTDGVIYRATAEKNMVDILKSEDISLANGKTTGKLGVNRLQDLFKEFSIRPFREYREKLKSDKSFGGTAVTKFDGNYFVAAQRAHRRGMEPAEVLNNVNEGLKELLEKLSNEPGKRHFKDYFRACFYGDINKEDALKLNDLNNEIIADMHNVKMASTWREGMDRYIQLEQKLLGYGLEE